MKSLVQALRMGFMLIVGVGVSSGVVADEASSRREDQLKAAYLFNFVKFVEWPASMAAGVIEICFIGASGVHASLETTTADKRIGERRIIVRSLSDQDAISQCGVVYLEDNDSCVSVTALRAARENVLTVSEGQDFTRCGGVIRLFTAQNKLRFIINVDNAKRAGLRISSNLLKLASSVEHEGAP